METHRGGLISKTVLGASDGATSLLLSSISRSIAVVRLPISEGMPMLAMSPCRLSSDDF